MAENEGNNAEVGLANSRSRRTKSDKLGRLSAFQKLKNLNGSKNKYEVSSVIPVYEEVDEREYSRQRRNKMEDDWIVDDDGSGYVEDGREIFDEEDDDDIFTNRKGASKGKQEKKKEKDAKCKGNIKNMLINMPVKKRKAECDIGLDQDELLGNILQDLGQSSPSTARPCLAKKPRPSLSPSKVYSSPINPFSTRSIDSPLNRNKASQLVNKTSSLVTKSTPVSKEASVHKSPERSNDTYADMQSPKPSARLTSTNSNNALPNRLSTGCSSMNATKVSDDYSAGSNEGTPIVTTPIRGIARQPRSMLRENVATPSPPKAKRSLPITPHEPIKEETEADFADMDFSDLPDDDMMNNILEAECSTSAARDTPALDVQLPTAASASTQEDDKHINRGFTSSARSGGGDRAAAWEGLKTSMDGEDAALQEEVVVPELSLDTSSLPLVTEDGKQVLRLYWLDAYEEPFRQAGCVFVFGKVWIPSAKTHVSCCLTVRNVPRRIFLLPRTKRINLKTKEVVSDTVTMKDVYDEFNDCISSKFGIKEFKSRQVKKRYAFDKMDVPNEAEYLEILYSADYEAVPADLCGETFSHVFGHSSSCLETFLLDRRLRGPCWLTVREPQTNKLPLSWCKVEVVATSPNQVKVSEACKDAPPPMVVVTLTLRTILNPKTHLSEVAAVGCLVHHSFPLDKLPPQPPFTRHFCVLSKPSGGIWPWDFKTQVPQYKHTRIERTESERALLGFLLAKLHQLDPDVIVGHDILGYDLGILLHRLAANKIPHWSRLGRLKRLQMPKLTDRGYAERAAVCGRLVCDVKLSAKELIRAKSYDLMPLAAQVLRIPDEETLGPVEVRAMYESSQLLLQLVSLTMQSSFHVVRLLCELNVLPLALQITNIAGNVLSRTLLGGRSERNEFLLLHAFIERNYIPPDRVSSAKNKNFVKEGEDGVDVPAVTGGRRKAAYTGGLVLEPKKGFYDKFILLMDFNSLYPSIIQEYNICFTTIDRQASVAADHDSVEPALPEMPEPDQPAGVLPTEIRKLVESRRAVKQLMKAPDLTPEARMQFDIRQKALKLTANSMYGCLGFSHSRFHAAHLAAMVTGKGREILLHTRDLVQKLNFDVIYGDTDSIMINTNCTDYDQVFKLGHKIKSEVNKLYKQLELEIDGVFKYMLLLKKKKYAALTMIRLPSGKVVAEPEIKGLDIVRRDWSVLAANAGKHVLDQILSEQGPDERVNNIHAHLEQLAVRLTDGKVELSELVITKQLTKRPEDYPDKAALAHVQVALRLNTAGGKTFRQGDTVPYIICQDGTNNPVSQRAYHPDELRSNSVLTIDTRYYLGQQLHPVVARLCDPIEGSDAARIAECLGLDPGQYRAARQYQDEDPEAETNALELPPEERYRGCARFTFRCSASGCDTIVTMDAPFRQGPRGQEPCLLSCPNPKCGQPLYANVAPLCTGLTLQIREHMRRYYDGWMVCEDPGCSNRTNVLPLQLIRGFPVCDVCQQGVLIREYTESQLYKQLCFYDYIFDFQKACQLNKDDRIRDDGLRRAYALLRNEVQRFLSMSAYSHVDLGTLFTNLFIKNAQG